MRPIRVILHPTDFSFDSEEAFLAACSLARDYDARLVVLHVESPEVAYGGIIAGPAPDLYRAELMARLRSQAATASSVRAEPILRQGEPAAEILRVASEIDSDLIVMGTRGRSGLGRLLIGSVCEAVLRRAECPVLVTRSRRPEASGAEPAETTKNEASPRIP